MELTIRADERSTLKKLIGYVFDEMWCLNIREQRLLKKMLKQIEKEVILEIRDNECGALEGLIGYILADMMDLNIREQRLLKKLLKQTIAE